MRVLGGKWTTYGQSRLLSIDRVGPVFGAKTLLGQIMHWRAMRLEDR